MGTRVGLWVSKCIQNPDEFFQAMKGVTSWFGMHQEIRKRRANCKTCYLMLGNMLMINIIFWNSSILLQVIMWYSCYSHDSVGDTRDCMSSLSIENLPNSRASPTIHDQKVPRTPFDGNEMPSNAINTNNSEKPSRIAGIVLSRRTGFVIAHQKGTLMDIEITWLKF